MRRGPTQPDSAAYRGTRVLCGPLKPACRGSGQSCGAGNDRRDGGPGGRLHRAPVRRPSYGTPWRSRRRPPRVGSPSGRSEQTFGIALVGLADRIAPLMGACPELWRRSGNQQRPDRLVGRRRAGGGGAAKTLRRRFGPGLMHPSAHGLLQPVDSPVPWVVLRLRDAGHASKPFAPWAIAPSTTPGGHPEVSEHPPAAGWGAMAQRSPYRRRIRWPGAAPVGPACDGGTPVFAGYSVAA